MPAQEVPVPDASGNKRKLAIGMAYGKNGVGGSTVPGTNSTASDAFWNRKGYPIVISSIILLARSLLLGVTVYLYLKMPVIIAVLCLAVRPIGGEGQECQREHSLRGLRVGGKAVVTHKFLAR